jgi:hypothetical protein
VLHQEATVVRLDNLLDLGMYTMVGGVKVIQTICEAATKGSIFSLKFDQVIIAVDAAKLP